MGGKSPNAVPIRTTDAAQAFGRIWLAISKDGNGAYAEATGAGRCLLLVTIAQTMRRPSTGVMSLMTFITSVESSGPSTVHLV